MFSAALNALGDLASARLRGIFWRAVGLTIILFIAIFAVVEGLIAWLANFPYQWLESFTEVVSGLGLVILFFFLMGPVTAFFAGLFLDEVAEAVEQRSYPNDAPGQPLETWRAVLIAIQFGALVLGVMILALPFVLFGVGAAAMLAANAYLLGREYFSMVAMRHMPPREAAAVRRRHAGKVFIAGFLPALMSLAPVVNLLTPFFATAYFVHLFKALEAPASPS